MKITIAIASILIGYQIGHYLGATTTMDILSGDIVDINNNCFVKLDSLDQWRDSVLSWDW